MRKYKKFIVTVSMSEENDNIIAKLLTNSLSNMLDNRSFLTQKSERLINVTPFKEEKK